MVVEIEPGQVDDASTTVTVPSAELEPVDSSTSNWAQFARYERAVGEAIARVADDLDHIETRSTVGAHEVDLLARYKDGRQIVVEVKASPVSPATLRRVLLRTATVAREANAAWLVVLPDFTRSEGDTMVQSRSVVSWAGEKDDNSLRRALRDALTTHERLTPGG